MGSELTAAIVELDEERVRSLVQAQLSAGADPLQLLDDCREGMTLIGQRYEAGVYFLSDLIMAGEIFKEVGNTVAPHLAAGQAGTPRGTVVVGTVHGDIHDIGKDIVVTMLRGANYQVQDLGVDVPPERFVEAVQASGASIVGLSGLLTISFDAMRNTVAALDKAGLRPAVKVMIGGGPVNDKVRVYAGADAWGADAQAAVALCNRWTGA